MGRFLAVGLVAALVAMALSIREIADLQTVVRVYVPHAGFIGHFGLFALLGLTLGWAAPPGERGRALLSLGALALGLELVQEVLPGRSVEAEDILANALGTLSGFLTAWGLRRLRAPP